MSERGKGVIIADRKTPRPGTLAERAQRTERVIDRFRTRRFDWAGANCWKLTAAMARAMGRQFPPVPQFRSPLGAKRALIKAGVTCAEDYLDRHFERLASPAFALVGDLVLLPGDPDGNGGLLDAVCVADGQGNIFGWHAAAPDDAGVTAIKFATADAIGAWRL